MAIRNSRALFLVNAAILAVALVHLSAQERVKDPIPQESTKDLSAQESSGTSAVEALWIEAPQTEARDLFHGPGGPELAPGLDARFSWVSTDTTGYSTGFEVRDAAGRKWNVKMGPEAQTEVAASRVLWAIGYHQPPTYHVMSWHLSGGPGGQQGQARFRVDIDGASVVADWSWEENPFVATQPYRGLIVANILLNSWDWKASNNKIYRGPGTQERYVVRDLGASLGRTSSSRLLWILPVPMRGFGQGSRNDIDGFEAQGFIKDADAEGVDFDFDTIYTSVVERVRPEDVRWTSERFSRLSDQQWDDIFRAAGYTPDIRARYIKKIKAKIAEGLAVS
jgi:hypothetical protein